MADTWDDVQRIQERGLLGFVEVVEKQCARLLDLAESGAGDTDPGWQEALDARASGSELLDTLSEALHGGMPPLGQLVLVFGLDLVETTLVTTLWGLATSETLARRARTLELAWSAHLVRSALRGAEHAAADAAGHLTGNPAEFPAGFPAGLIARLAFPDLPSQELALQALRPQARLRRFVLVRLADGQRRDPRRERVELDPDIAAALLGIWRPPPMAEGAVRARDGHAPGEIELYAEHAAYLPGLREALVQPHVHVALIGRPGAGKRTLVRAAARAEGRSLIEVRLRRAPADPERLTELLLRCQRDALLRQAVLYVELADDALPPAILQVFDADPGRLVLGVPAERPALAAAALRASWPALAVVALPALELAAQPALWAQILARHGASAPPRAALEAHACRPGLVLGDLARAAATALAPGSAPAGPDALALALAAALAAAFARELGALAEALWLPGAGPEAATADEPAAASLRGLWADYAGDIRGGEVQLSAWGVPEQQHYVRPVIAHAAGDDLRRVADRARVLASAVHMPLYRVDLGYLVASLAEDPGLYFERLFAAAARAGAMLLITPIDALSSDRPWTRSLANALAEHLERPLLPVLLHGTAQVLPVALESRIQHYLDAPV
jgi:hypothetical protein